MRSPRFSRRSVLTGMAAGAAFSTRLFRAIRAEAALPTAQRMAFFFHANGSHYGWTPTGTGADFVLTPHLAPLEPIRSDIVILRGLTLQRGAGNAHKAATFSAMGAGAGTSFDQVLAQAIKGTLPLPSLELAIGLTSGGGGVAPSLSQVNGAFLPGERNVFAAYQRVAARMSAGSAAPAAPMTADPQAMQKALLARQSVLDYVREETGALSTRLGSDEKKKLDLYLSSLRDLEKGLGNYASDLRVSAACGTAKPLVDPGVPIAHIQDMPKIGPLFLDVMALALACGVTKVVSMMWGGGESAENNDYIPIRDWHITTHGNPNAGAGQSVIKMQAFIATQWAYFVQKVKSYSDGEGSLLDNTLILWGTQNGNTNQTNFAKEDHDRHNTPFILAGRAGGTLKTGRVLDCNGVNHNDLYIAIARAFGQPLTTVGDPTWCKGPLPGLFT